MFSQYADGRFSPISVPSTQKAAEPQFTKKAQESPKHSALLGELTGGISQLFGRIEKQFSFGQLDTGDILLVLIVLFLFLEGDNLELVITLGLMLLLGFNDDPSSADASHQAK